MSPLQRWVLAAACLVGVGARARADEPSANCSVRMIQALHEGAGIDPKITTLRPYLEKAPFTAWKQFKLLDEKELVLAPHASSSFALPNGREGTLSYVDHFVAKDGDHRLRLQLTILDGKKKMLATTFVLDEGGVVLQAGQKLDTGLLILGFSCKTQQ